MEKRITATDLRAGKKLCGAWAHLGSNLSAEILAKAGYDVIIPDMEHAPYSLPALVSVLQAVESSGCFTMVRAPWNDQVAIKQILDCGADGIHIPYVNTRQEAEYAVRACKYPPQGVRGVATSQRATCYGMEKMAYLTRANRDVVVMLAIETPEAVANIDDIASVEGVDGIFLGPSDLSTSMGYLAAPAEMTNDLLKIHQYTTTCISTFSQIGVERSMNAPETVESAAKRHGKFLSTISSGGEDMRRKFDLGYSLLYLFSDTTGLAAAAQAHLKEAREYIGQCHDAGVKSIGNF